MRFHEFRFYSIFLDTRAARLSLFDKTGREFFSIIPVSNGKDWRERRNDTLDAIHAFMVSPNAQPGEVRV